MSGIVHFKFKSSNSYDSVSFDGAFVSVAELKTLIAEKKGLSKDATSELLLSDPRTQAEYKDDTALVPKSSSVLVRRVPASQPVLQSHTQPSLPQPALHASSEPQISRAPQAADDEFGGELYTEQKDEDEALAQMLAQTGQKWEKEVREGIGRGRGRGRYTLGRGFGREVLGREGRGRESRDAPSPGVLPRGYVCYRCGQQGHHIADCPTNTDPDFKRIRPAVGVPMVMLARNQEGGLLLPDGQTGSLQPNEDAFMKEMMGAPTLQKAADTTANSQAEVPSTSQAELPAASSAMPPAVSQPELAATSALPLPAITTSGAAPAASDPDSKALMVVSIAEPTLAGDSELFPPSLLGDGGNPAAMMFPQPGGLPPWDMLGGLPGPMPPMPFGAPPPFGSGFAMPGEEPFQDAPLSKEEFQRLQEEMRRKQERHSRHRRGRSRSRSHGRSRHRSSSKHRRRSSREKAAPPRKIDLILRKDLEAAGKSSSPVRRTKRSRRDALPDASSSPRVKRRSKRSSKHDLHAAALAGAATAVPSSAATGNGVAELGDDARPGDEFNPESSAEFTRGAPPATGKDSAEAGKAAPSSFSVPQLLDESVPFQAPSNSGDLRDLIQSRKRSGAGTTGLNSRLLRGVGSRWQPEKPAVAASNDATDTAATGSDPPAAAANDGQQPTAIARAVRDKQVEIEVGPSTAVNTPQEEAKDTEAAAVPVKAASPPSDAKALLPKTFSIPMLPTIPPDEDDRARRKAKKHKKEREHKRKRSRPSRSQDSDADAGAALEPVLDADIGNGRVADKQPVEEALPIEGMVQLPQLAGYDGTTEGQSAVRESIDLQTASLGSSGEGRKQRKEGSLFTRALAQAARPNAPAGTRGRTRWGRDDSPIVQPADDRIEAPQAEARRHEESEPAQELVDGRQEYLEDASLAKERRHKHSRRERAVVESGGGWADEERHASARRREHKERKESKHKHKHKHSKRKHQEEA